MARERILILVKTYPTLSTSYGELVCTAGLREDGSWLRIFPVPFRRLEEYKKYEKFRYIEADLKRSDKDSRPDSYRIDTDTIIITADKIDTKDEWRRRREVVLKKGKVYADMSEIIHRAQKERALSLVTFKLSKIIDFKIEPDDEEWDQKKLDGIKAMKNQGSLFEDWDDPLQYDLVRKIPWKFKYVFEDSNGKQSKLMIEDWEIGALYWRQLNAKSEEALEDVKNKYMGFAEKTDLHFFLGTTKEHHYTARNPFIIIGCFPIPFETQPQFNF